MTRLHFIVAVASLALGCRSAAAQECSPNDFKTVHFDQLTELSRYSLLSSISKSDYESNNFKGSATVPSACPDASNPGTQSALASIPIIKIFPLIMRSLHLKAPILALIAAPATFMLLI